MVKVTDLHPVNPLVPIRVIDGSRKDIRPKLLSVPVKVQLWYTSSTLVSTSEPLNKAVNNVKIRRFFFLISFNCCMYGIMFYVCVVCEILDVYSYLQKGPQDGSDTDGLS